MVSITNRFTHLSRQVEQAIFEKYVLCLAPCAIYDNYIVLHSANFLVLHQLFQVLGFWTWIQD